MPNKVHAKNGKEALFLLRKICKEEGIRIFWYRPLAIGMYQQLKERIGDKMLSGDIFKALRNHCKSHTYLIMLKPGAQRFDINGKVSGVVTEEEAQRAHKERGKLHRKLLNRGKGKRSVGSVTQKPGRVERNTPSAPGPSSPEKKPPTVVIKKKRVITPPE